MPPRFNHPSLTENPSSTTDRPDRLAPLSSGINEARDPQKKTPKVWHSYLNDSLGKHVAKAVQLLHASSSWESFVQAYRGPSLLSSAVGSLPHPAAPLLANWRSEGVPVTMSGEDWSHEKIQETARRGPHKSAKDYADFVRDEMASFAEQGF